MKPPVLGPETPHDPRPALWTTGAIFGVAGLVVAVVDNPLVPLSYVFHLIPIGLGGALGAALLRERYGPRLTVVYGLLMAWLVFAVLTDKTSVAPVFLAASVYSLARAILRTVEWDS